MKIHVGKTYAEKEAAKLKWHLWFAWFPVRIGEHLHVFEKVQRKGEKYKGASMYCKGITVDRIRYKYQPKDTPPRRIT